MEADTEQSEFEGLADIVSNLMAVFILLTMIVLTLQLVAVTEESAQSGTGEEQRGEFRSPPVDPFGKPVEFVLVDAKGMTILDKDGLVLKLVLNGPSTLGIGDFFASETTTGSLEAKLSAPDASEAIDDMVLSVRTSKDWSVEPIIPHGEGALAEIQSIAQPEYSLSFVVLPDGIAPFVAIHDQLLASGQCFRWEPWGDFNQEEFRRVTDARTGAPRCPN